MVYYLEDVRKVYANPLPTLIYFAQEIHQQSQVADAVQVAAWDHPETVERVVVESNETTEKCLEQLIALSNSEKHPDVVEIDAGTPSIGVFEFVRIVAVARILLPKTLIRLAENCAAMSAGALALCLSAGANSAFFAGNMLEALGLRPLDVTEHHKKVHGCKGDGSCGHCTCGRH
ncbi:MAG: hypothetical protein E7037_05595 [Verrucomicrobia bacterium]|nr:hypothetical protein [Verrucomicrobiota bacterium]